jgi:hypothetical protein
MACSTRGPLFIDYGRVRALVAARLRASSAHGVSRKPRDPLLFIAAATDGGRPQMLCAAVPIAAHYALADTMIPVTASTLDRLLIVLRHHDEGAEGSTTITAAPLEQRYAAGSDRGRLAYDAQARLLLGHCLGQDRR